MDVVDSHKAVKGVHHQSSTLTLRTSFLAEGPRASQQAFALEQGANLRRSSYPPYYRMALAFCPICYLLRDCVALAGTLLP